MEITKREIIASISIVVIMLVIGLLISGKISENQADQNEKYNKAIKIKSADMFEYGMRTNVGNAFVYGDLKAVDTVTFPEIGGKYMYVKKVKERYTKHTRVVTSTVNGRTVTRTETYWTWDFAGKEDLTSKKLSFLGVEFNSDRIDIPGSSYIKTIKESWNIRYKYYGTKTKHTGTIFTELKNNTITKGSNFYNYNIDETVELLHEDFVGLALFWIAWIVLTGGLVVIFYTLENRWLY